MKTKLPLPIKSDKKLPWTVKLQNTVGKPFSRADKLGMSFTEADVEYIKNVIQTHKLYRIIYKQGILVGTLNNDATLRRCKVEAEFLTPFMNDSKCPDGVRNFLYFYIGRLNYSGLLHRAAKPSVVQFLAERWMDKCL